jgi:hypothetical protein
MTPTVDELFDRFRASYDAGEPADTGSLLEQLSGDERRELEGLIEAFLAHAPPEAYDADRFEAFRAEPWAAELRAAVDERLGESWTTLLRAARDEAEIPRSTLVQRLAAALGVADREKKVAAYYHEMELGALPPKGVSSRVLEALGAIVGVPVERLRAAGERLVPPPPASPGAVFARTASAPASRPAPARAARSSVVQDSSSRSSTAACSSAAHGSARKASKRSAS